MSGDPPEGDAKKSPNPNRRASGLKREVSIRDPLYPAILMEINRGLGPNAKLV